MSNLLASDDGRFVYGGIDPRTGEQMVLQRVTRWLDNTVIKPSHIDNVYFFAFADGTYGMRVWPRGEIDMRCYLVGDGSTDNLPFWNAFLAYMRQATANFYLVLSIPNGTYMHSGTVDFQLLRIDMKLASGAIMLWDRPCIWMQRRRTDDDLFDITGGRWGCNNIDYTDGLIDPTTPEFAAFVDANGFPRQMKNSAGQTLGDWMSGVYGGPNPRMYSLNPADYKYSGIFSTGVTNIKDAYFYNCSGPFINLFAPAIGVHDPLAPAGYDCSYSSIINCRFVGGIGPQISIFGSDANHVTVERCGHRESRTYAIFGESQTGPIVGTPNSQENFWGNYMLVSHGSPALNDPYGETNTNVSSVINGTGSLRGGSNNTQVLGSIDALNQKGNRFANIQAGEVISYKVSFGSYADRFHTLHFDNIGGDSNVQVRGSFGGATDDQAFIEFYQAKQSLFRGRWMGSSGVAIERLAVGGLRNEVASGFAPPVGGKWYPGGEFKNKLYDGTNTRKWVCKGAGLAPGDTYAALCGVTVTTRAGMPQHLDLSAPTTFIELWDMFTLPGQNGGQPVQVVGVFPSSGPITAIDVSQAVNVSQAMPVYPTALFQAITS